MSLIKLILIILAASNAKMSARLEPVRVTAFSVNGSAQADAHLLQLPNQTRYLVDVGNDNPMLLNKLKALKISSIHRVLISHSHKDHYAGLRQLIQGGITINEVFWNFAPEKICNREIPWGCDFKDLNELKALLKEKKISLKSLKQGEILFQSGEVSLKVLFANDGIHTPIGEVDVNDMSVLLRLTNGKKRMLFTGDLNLPLGKYLANNFAKELEADILKVPHHGAESVAPPEFFDAVKFSLALVNISPDIWNTDRCAPVRKYLQKSGAAFLVTGIEGDVEIQMKPDSFRVSHPVK